jgi:predicted metal-dependent hydrolase
LKEASTVTKAERTAGFLQTLGAAGTSGFPPAYTHYFELFNAGRYYEAHDALEHLWLACTDSNRGFYKGLIQIAGAFVHISKQHENPTHPVHGRRLRPAARLLESGVRHIETFAPLHLGLDVSRFILLCLDVSEQIRASGFSANPWNPDRTPRAPFVSK